MGREKINKLGGDDDDDDDVFGELQLCTLLM